MSVPVCAVQLPPPSADEIRLPSAYVGDVSSSRQTSSWVPALPPEIRTTIAYVVPELRLYAAPNVISYQVPAVLVVRELPSSVPEARSAPVGKLLPSTALI